ncbi:MAG TPA: class I tRNA ligase family protein [Thermoplasmata archaeon]|nr:class I tRNA ligase family protein [Thermoplasmata archaeon]
MRTLPLDLDPHRVESEGHEFWKEHHLGPAALRTDPLPAGGVTVAIGTVSVDAAIPFAVLAHLIVADVAERSLRLAGRASTDALYFRPPTDPKRHGELTAELDHLAVDFGRASFDAVPPAALNARIQSIVQGMAERGLIVARNGPLRVCPQCGEPRTPEKVLYREENRPVYLVRVRIAGTEPPLHALVWTDAVWKLLAAHALLIHPDRLYVRGRYSRHGTTEEILLAKEAVDRLAEWRPGGSFELVEEAPGRHWTGSTYDNPLRSEMPSLSTLEPPGGTVVGSTEVGTQGTGLVLLTPAHGPSDAFVAETQRLTARPVVGARGILLADPRHKYSGLPLDTAEACIGRDLADDGAIFSEVRSRCGVPRCLACGTELYWYPGRAWCLDLAKVSPLTRERYSQIAAGERFPEPSGISSWPLSHAEPSTDPADPRLAECSTCGRLSADATSVGCSCGAGPPLPVRRKLLWAIDEPLRTWAGRPPQPAGGVVWFLLPERRRLPQLLHQLLALEAADVRPSTVRWTLLRTLPPEGSSESLASAPPADAVRAAIVRLAAGIPGRQTLAQAIVEETHRLYRIWTGTRSLLVRMASEEFATEDRLPTTRPSDIPAEDLAFLAAFERTRSEVLRLYERGAWAAGYLRLCRFMDHAVRDRYVPLLLPRLFEPRGSPGKLAAFRVLAYFMPRMAELAAPVAPFTAEAIHRAVRGDTASVFERPYSPILESYLDAGADAALESWGDIVAAVRRGRRLLGLPVAERLRRLVLVAASEERAALLRPQLPVLGRLLRADQVVLHSPSDPWDGRRVEARPNVEAIKRAFPVYHRRIIKVIDQLDGRQIRAALKSQSLAVGVEGQPAIRIPPSMIDVVESLPESVVPFRWRGGEMYAELPAGAAHTVAVGSAVPAELERVRRYLERRVRRSRSGPEAPTKMFLHAGEPLRGLLQRHAEVLAAAIGVGQLLVVDSPRLFVPAETSYGRDRRGQRFLAWIPGQAAPVRRLKAHRRRSGDERAPGGRVSASGEPAEFDCLAPEVKEREERILLLSSELDPGGMLTYLGPTKLGIAWDYGFHSRSEIASAEPGTLGALPGFGPVVAQELIHTLAPDRSLPEIPLPWARAMPSRELADSAVERDPPISPAVPSPEPEALPPPPPAPAPLAPMIAPTVPSLRPVPAVSTPSAAATPVPPPPPSGVEVSIGPTRVEGWDRFLDALANGMTGLWVGRVFPQPLQAAGAAHDVRFLWLSATTRPNAVRPGEPEAIAAQIVASLQTGEVRAVIIEEIEYLVALNGAPAIRGMLREIDTAARAVHGRVWVPLVPELLGRGTPAEIQNFGAQVPPADPGGTGPEG